MWEGRGDPAGMAAVVAAVLCVALLVDGAMARGGGGGEEPVTQLSNGFTATHSASADAPLGFEPVLYAPSGAFAFGFLRVGLASLDLAVVHLPSSFPVWRATPARVADWSRTATLSFDRSLVLAGPDGAVLWDTLNVLGDTVVLLNSSNLVIQRYGELGLSWQSFDFPSDTLVLDQNISMSSSSPLISANRRFALRFSKTYMSLHMEFYGGRTTPMYWQYTAREAQPENATKPAVYGCLDSRGFFGLYIPGVVRSIDTIAFDTFALNLTGVFRRMTLDGDGNLRAYYWTKDSKAWTSDYKAITGPCELPTSCGAYGLCVPGESAATQCQCLVNGTGTSSPSCHAAETTDLCGGGGGEQLFDVVRRNRVSVAYKDQLPFSRNKTAAECEQACAGNCSCWGAVHNGGSGYCHLIGFPVETMVYEADDRKTGYFKVRKAQQSAAAGGAGRRRAMSPGATAATVLLTLALACLVAAGAYKGYRMWERRRRRRRDDGLGMEQELTPGAYKDLKSMASPNNSFKS